MSDHNTQEAHGVPNITPLLFEGESLVRIVMRDGDPWFVATDVCAVLGLSNAAMTVKGLDEDEVGVSIAYTSAGALLRDLVAIGRAQA